MATHRFPLAADARTVVLVEGESDQQALEALAARHDRDLVAERVSIVAMGGAKSVGRLLRAFGPQGLDLRLAGLCDAAEEGDFRRGLQRAGLGSDLTRADMEALGFYVCVGDLEDELIRSLGVSSVERIVDEQGELRRFVNVYVGNDDVRFLENLATATPEGTQISVIPAVAGG